MTRRQADRRIEIMPNVSVEERQLSWFVSRMFNPEDNLWVWIRRLANLATFPILVLLLMQVFQ